MSSRPGAAPVRPPQPRADLTARVCNPRARAAGLRRRFAVCALLAGSALFAQPADRHPSTVRARSAPVVTVYFENDVVSGTDQHYTNGLKISWLSADLVEWGLSGWRQRLVEFLPFVNRPEGQKNFGVAFGQTIHTPGDIAARVPDPTDRPYAGWSYLAFSFLSKTPDISDTFAIQIGLIGPHSLAEDTQRLVHEWSDIAPPRGWDHQLRDELGVNVIYERRWRLFARTLRQRLGADFIPHLGASLGNVQTYASAGGTVRLGLNLPSDFGVQLARPGSVGGSPADDLDPRVALDRNFSLFLFGAADGRAVARDIFLDGNTFRASRSVTREPFVADLSLGLGVIAGRWQVTYTQVWRSREFKSQRDDPSHFGSVTLSLAY